MSRPAALWCVFALCCLLGLGAPVLPWVTARAPLLVAGVPFPLLWNVAWVIAAFCALGALHLSTPEER